MTNLDEEEPPPKTNQPPSSSMSSPSSFSSLPRDLVLNVLACVPKRLYPILCCVSKNLRSLVRSADIYKTRSSLRKDSVYISFISTQTYHWFSLRRIGKDTTENVFASVDFSFLPEHCRCSSSVFAVGPEIFFIPGTSNPSSSFRIFNTQSGNVREGPSLLVNRTYNCVGLVGGKIYMIGGCRGDSVSAEVFDLKTQTWEEALIPERQERFTWITPAKVSVDRKVCALSFHHGMTAYDPIDGSCETFELPNDNWGKTAVCVIDNVLFVYFFRFGLMWFDSQLMLWRVVNDLDLDTPQGVAMAEYYGKLAFLWERPSLLFRGSKEIWCIMIGLARSEEGFNGAAEPSQLLRIVPHSYSLYHCLSLG
ncbi:PREDICTED: F-box/kelch-repeat protein At2g44700-like [Camelina sativa]|uniref:F-box/kelch-repeat protein At2g44700-like n=1 Tax=Camelina sativa TaxID=90675 RepID=A0ABM0ZAT5_CAMSA|nr:PREDICTED: F-box/kelch-repeat protein At2g44700-like [Camelina sativa]